VNKEFEAPDGASIKTWKSENQKDSREGEGGLTTEEIAELKRDYEEADDFPEEVLEKILKNVRTLAFDQDGTRILQRVLQVSNERTKARIAASLTGDAIQVMRSKHANYVFQTMVQEMPPKAIEPLIQEILEVAHEYSRHAYGCRIFCRVIEYTKNKELADILTREPELHGLIQHKYGSHVIRKILEHGTAEHKERIENSITKDGKAITYAMHEYASFVVEAILDKKADRQSTLVKQLLDRKDLIKPLLGHPRGRHIVNKLKPLDDDLRAMAKDHRYGKTRRAPQETNTAAPPYPMSPMAMPGYPNYPPVMWDASALAYMQYAGAFDPYAQMGNSRFAGMPPPGIGPFSPNGY
jgi:hypothetical protein